jgi:hypothetical protein
MRTDPRLIGFTAHRFQSPLSKPPVAICSIRRSPDSIKSRAHPSSRNSPSEFLRPCNSPFTFRRPASPAVGFRSLFATSHRSSYVFSRSIPVSASVRPQAFAASRRLLPLRCSQAYSIPLPRPGSSFVQGLLSRRSHPSSSEGAFLHAVAASPLVPTVQLSSARLYVHVRSLSASRLLSASGRVSRVRLFTSPKAAPLFEFHAPPGARSLDAGFRSRGCRPLMMLRVRCSRAHAPCDARGRAHLRGTGSLSSPRQIIEEALVPYSCESLSTLLLSFRTGSNLAESHTEVCGVAVVHLAMPGS